MFGSCIQGLKFIETDFESLVTFFFRVDVISVPSSLICGYHLPKGAVVMPNLWAHHQDPKIFPEPRTFKPERFLDENGQVDVDFAQNIVPFGVGKRRCVGENLARQEVYLLFASTIQKFKIRLSPDDEKNLDLDRDAIDGLARMVKPCKFIFNDRY
uniref:Cytochrome P450 n=1 Tax=Romanomermis culicivorax TaxID=13658 RepID=A0A915HYR8_ROMCU